VDVLPLIRHIEKLLRAMGGKRHKPATPPHNRKLTGVWKKMNSSASPVKLLPAPADKDPNKPWTESDTEPSQVNETECWSVSSYKPEKNKDTIAETPKKSRGGDGTSHPHVTEESKEKKTPVHSWKKKPKYSGQLLQFF
jgi:hypothetical protein